MAGILNSVYVVLIVLVVLAGLGIVSQRLNDTNNGDSRWLEFSAVAVAFLFILVLAVELLL